MGLCRKRAARLSFVPLFVSSLTLKDGKEKALSERRPQSRTIKIPALGYLPLFVTENHFTTNCCHFTTNCCGRKVGEDRTDSFNAKVNKVNKEGSEVRTKGGTGRKQL